MSLTVACPGCKRTLRVPDTAAGKKIKCPLCGEMFAIPAVPTTPVSPASVTTGVSTPPRTPPAPPPPPKRPEAIQPSHSKNEPETVMPDDEPERESPDYGTLPFLPIEFNVVVKDPSKTLKGTFKAKVSRSGLVLKQKKEEVEIPVGTPAEHLKGSRLAVELEQGRVELTIQKPFYYLNRLTRDVAALLNGKKRALNVGDYRMPWYLYIPILLPIGIPIMTRGGALPGAVGGAVVGGLAAASFGIAQQEQLPIAVRILLMVLLAAAGYVGIILFIINQYGTWPF